MIGRMRNPWLSSPTGSGSGISGCDPGALGQTLALNKGVFTIIGILPRRYAGPLFGDWADFYVSMANQSQLPSDDSLASPNDWWVQIMARPAPGADEAKAVASLNVIFRQALSMSDVRIDEPGILLESGRRGPLMVRQPSPSRCGHSWPWSASCF